MKKNSRKKKIRKDKTDCQSRPGWDEYFIGIARGVAARATCLRRRYGAVITKHNTIVSTGYNGAPRGMKDCLEVGSCTRKELQIPHGQRYELCHSVHAEANAIIRASAEELDGAVIYICGFDSEQAECHSEPCMMCKRMILNARIARVVYSDGRGGIVVETPDDWLSGRI